MAMQERLVVTLDHKQIKEACEQYLRARISVDEQAIAEVSQDWHIVVRVAKRRATRKSKDSTITRFADRIVGSAT